ncbi:MAG: hypothetical protein KDE34_17770, partial [Anaerolineales bacterium]|nr:hypothetical protein [Anaerolineales bacterium]
PSMTADATWQSWSRSEALRSGSKYAGIYLDYTPSGAGVDMYMEASDCTLTLTNTPGFTGFAEQGNYNLDCTLTDDDGDAIQVTFQMETGETLTIDTDNATAIYEKDGSSQYGAVTRLGGPRLTWLKLKPGTNTWQFDDVGTAGLTIAVSYEERRGA